MPNFVYWIGVGTGIVLMVWGGWVYFRPNGGERSLADMDLQSLDRAELKRRAIKLATEVRAAEAQAHSKTMEQIHAGNFRDSWHQFRAAFELEYRTKHRAELLAICNEIARRLGMYPPYTGRPNALDDAMFAGPHPATEAADYVDALARRLG